MLLAVAALTTTACDKREAPPPSTTAGNAEPKRLDTKALEKGAEALQDLTPVRAIDHYLNGFHVMKDDPRMHMEAHHYCKSSNEALTQCVIFDGTTREANIIGIEYIVSEKLWDSLPEAEKPSWHPHNYEILSGSLVMPGVPPVAEKAALAKKINSYGKTWHVWDTGHAGHPAAQPLPVGNPLLAWSYNHDGEMPPELLRARDERFGIDTSERRSQRRELARDAHPQRGEDLLKGQLGPK